MQNVPFYYHFILKIVKPLYYLKLKMRNKTLPNEIAQRFGKTYPTVQTQKPIIWCHAVSLGETNTIAPILYGLLEQNYAIWITNTTHTGFARVEELFAEQIATGDVYHSFVPVDSESVVMGFLNHVKPIGALFVETELWANILAKLEQRNIASVLVNGRLSEKSAQGYQKFAKLSQTMMDNLSLIIAQDSDSAKRFRQIGASSEKIRLASSLKWSSQVNPLMINRANSLSKEWQLQQRKILLLASSHADEEKQLLQVFEKLQKDFDNLLLIIVPRHPERFDTVAELIENHTAKKVLRRSQNNAPSLENAVYLADSMGELGVWYALADIAFVGGSLVDIGGHNPIESAIVGKPVIMGKYTQSCQQVVDKLKDVGALKQVENIEELKKAFEIWLNDESQAKQAGQAGQQLAEQFNDATNQQLAMILECLAHNKEHIIAQEIRLMDNAPVGKNIIDDLAEM